MFCLLVQMSLSFNIQVVYLNFTGFNLQDHDSCYYDWMKVYDGSSTSARLIGEYCSTASPDGITSSGQYLFLYFHSDDVVLREGVYDYDYDYDYYNYAKGAEFQWHAQSKLFGVLFLPLPQMHWPGETFAG